MEAVEAGKVALSDASQDRESGRTFMKEPQAGV